MNDNKVWWRPTTTFGFALALWSLARLYHDSSLVPRIGIKISSFYFFGRDFNLLQYCPLQPYSHLLSHCHLLRTVEWIVWSRPQDPRVSHVVHHMDEFRSSLFLPNVTKSHMAGMHHWSASAWQRLVQGCPDCWRQLRNVTSSKLRSRTSHM